MQILESTPWGVRSARLTLRHPFGQTTIVLFPMVHVGDPKFYATVYNDAFSQDVVLVEGGASPIAKRVTRSYRWIEGAKRIGLTVQPDYPSAETCRARIVYADLSAEDFLKEWRTIPLWQRLLVYFIAPLIGLERRIFGSREKIAKGLSMEDVESREEILAWSEETAYLDKVILHARDERLLERLNEQIDGDAKAPATVAIVYGAAHMRAVLRELINKKGYECKGAEWMTVFGL